MTQKLVYEAVLNPQGFQAGQRVVDSGLKDLQRNADRAARSLQSMTGGLTKIGNGFAGLGNAAYDAGRRITSALSGGLSILSRYASVAGVVSGILGGIATKMTVLDSAKFESTIGRIAIQTNASPQQTAALLAHAREVGIETPFGPQAVADSMLAESQRGRGVDEILKLTEASKKFALVANGDMKTAAETLSQVMFQFDLPMEKANDTALRLANATAATALNLEDLFVSLQFAGGAAGTFGVDLTELLAILGTLRAVAGASVASTALRNVMLVSSKLGNKSPKKLAELGLDEEDIAGTTFMSGAPKSIMDVVKKLNELSAARPESLMKMGFETRTIVALRQIEDMREKIQAVRVEIDDLDGAQQKYAASVQLADNQYRRLGTTADAVLLAIGSKLREAFELDAGASGISEMLAELSRTISAMPADHVGAIVDTLGAGLLAAFSTGVSFLAQTLPPVAIMFGEMLVRGIGSGLAGAARSAGPHGAEFASYMAQYAGMNAEQRAAEKKRLEGVIGGPLTAENIQAFQERSTGMFGVSSDAFANIRRATVMQEMMGNREATTLWTGSFMGGLSETFEQMKNELSANPTVMATKVAMQDAAAVRRREAENAAAARYAPSKTGPSIGIMQAGVVNNYGAGSAAARASPARPSGMTRTEAASR